MAFSLVNEIRKIQLSKNAEVTSQAKPNHTTGQADLKTAKGVSLSPIVWRSHGKPLTFHRSKFHETYGEKQAQSTLRKLAMPSAAPITRSHEPPSPQKAVSEELPVTVIPGFRCKAYGDSVVSCETINFKERLPGDGCASEEETVGDRIYTKGDHDRSGVIETSDLETLNDDSSSGEEDICDDPLDQEDIDDMNDENDDWEGSCDDESLASDDESVKTDDTIPLRQTASASIISKSSAARNMRRFVGHSASELQRKKSWVNEKQLPLPYPLLPSLFANVPPTIYFTIEGENVAPFPSEVKKIMNWKLSTITPKVIKSCIIRSGFKLSKKSADWIGYWGKHMKAGNFKCLRENQKVNHFPGTFQIGRKDRLWRNFSKMQIQFGKKEFNFVPQTFILPQDLRQLRKVWEDCGHKQKWIIKPPASARGIGIRVIHKWSQLPKKRAVIVQRYLSKPYLINGSKFDIRVYVYVTSFDPLRIYIFDDGLVRFATSKYSSSSKTLSNRYMHLTNYSINKKNLGSYTPSFDENTCQGHKWSLKSLFQYLKKRDVDSDQVWATIKDIAVKTIICAEPTVNTLVKQNVKSRYCCHELFGFDIIFDEQLKPWLLEVNISPSLHSNSPLDVAVKSQLVKDMLNLSGFRIPKPAIVPDFLRSMGNVVPKLKNKAACIFFMDETLGSSESDKISAERTWFEHVPLTTDEKYKHAYFTQRRVDENVKRTILDVLTPDDIRILMESDDELSRCGNFQRIFPSTVSDKYLRFFDTSRYYNMLLDEWVKRYIRDAGRSGIGIALLLGYSKRGLHIGATDDPTHQWGNSCSQSSLPARSTSAPAQLLQGQSEKTSTGLPSIKKSKKGMISHERSVDGTGKKQPTSLTAQVTRKVSSILQGRSKQQ